jgi:hypothetical protein
MKFSIIHPTARVEDSGWWRAYDSVLSGCDCLEDVEYIVVVHESRAQQFIQHDYPTFARFTIVVNRGRDCLVDQCNAGLLAASGEILCGNQDDMRYPEHWDTEIRKLLPDTSVLACVKAKTDGQRHGLLTIPTICTKRLSDALGMISPEYLSVFSDDEWSGKARMMGAVIPAPYLYFQHFHPDNGTAELDDVYSLENSEQAYELGRQVFERRKALGFPRVPFPGEENVQSIAFMLPGESFRFEWLASLLELGVAVGNAGWSVQRFLGYTTSCYSTRINLTTDLLEKSQVARPKYVFWLDDDNLIRPDQFMRLLHFLETNPQADGIVGWCWIRQKDRWGISCGRFWADDGVHLAPMELHELKSTPDPKPIEYSGFPAVLMRYEVLEFLGADVFRPYVARDAGRFFTSEQIKRIPQAWFAGEDTSFFLRAREKGMTFFVDPECEVGHLKAHAQQPDIQLYADSPAALKEWREKVNGKAVLELKESAM